MSWHETEHEFLDRLLVELKVINAMGFSPERQSSQGTRVGDMLRKVQGRLVELDARVGKISERGGQGMYAIFYHKPDEQVWHPVAGCCRFPYEQTAIDTAKGFADHPEGCLGYYPAAPVVFEVVKMIGRAERCDVVWTPYDGECDKQSHEHPYAIPKSERR